MCRHSFTEHKHMHRDRMDYLLDIIFNDLMSIVGFTSYFIFTLIKSGYVRHKDLPDAIQNQ